jgi:sensor histidine kinase YesM
VRWSKAKIREALKTQFVWLMAFAAWMIIGLSFTFNYYLFSGHYVEIFKKPPTFSEMMLWELPYWIIWAALAPVVFRLTRRFRLDRDNWHFSLLIHLSACVLISILHRAIYLILGWMLHVAAFRRVATISDLYSFLFFFNLPTGFMSYGTILLVSQVVDFYHSFQEKELKASQLKAELAEARLEAAQSQLQALRAQLHPHFLFNTLNSISALLEEDAEAADEMIARLGNFLRMTLDSSAAQQVTLAQELEFLGCYLDIERVRFQDRLSVAIDIEPQSLAARVPNLVLQPIVENAIRHAIAPRFAPGVIEIRARESDSRLLIQVKDDGPGLDENFREGIGLANTRARLERLYGQSHRFEMKNAAEGGLIVEVEIPFVTTEATATVNV